MNDGNNAQLGTISIRERRTFTYTIQKSVIQCMTPHLLTSKRASSMVTIQLCMADNTGRIAHTQPKTSQRRS